jgi:hypothetical protein
MSDKIDVIIQEAVFVSAKLKGQKSCNSSVYHNGGKIRQHTILLEN